MSVGDIISDVEDVIDDLTHHHHEWPWLKVNGLSVQLTPHRRLFMTTTVNLGHTIGLSLTYTDQNGNPMLTGVPVPDSVPTWSNTTPSTETLAVDAAGLTAVATPIAVGLDTISVNLSVGGVSFSASLSVEVDAAPQVLTGVAISPTVN